MQKRRLTKRLITILLCVCMIVPMGVTANTIDSIEARRTELRNQTAGLEAQRDALRDDQSKAEDYKTTLEDSITLTENKIEEAMKNIKTLNASISALEDKLALAEVEQKDVLEQLKKRIIAIYKTGDVGTVEVLLNATSFYDFSMLSELLKGATEHDKDLINQIEEFMTLTGADRDVLAKEKAQLASIKKELEADQANLMALNVENDQRINTLQNQRADVSSEIGLLESEEVALSAELEALIEAERVAEEARRVAEEERRKQEEASGGTPDSGNSGDGSSNAGGGGGDGSGMSDGFSPSWPLPGYGTGSITCYYGGYEGHRGLDIGAGYGTPIVAAQSGKVLSAEYSGNWGNQVLIYHNGAYSTRYAHMSSFAVSSGEYVERGQIIGYVGSTGFSTGNHLHFEVIYYGNRIDPIQFL